MGTWLNCHDCNWNSGLQSPSASLFRNMGQSVESSSPLLVYSKDQMSTMSLVMSFPHIQIVLSIIFWVGAVVSLQKLSLHGLYILTSFLPRLYWLLCPLCPHHQLLPDPLLPLTVTISILGNLTNFSPCTSLSSTQVPFVPSRVSNESCHPTLSESQEM